jgi:hypothetical protein
VDLDTLLQGVLITDQLLLVVVTCLWLLVDMPATRWRAPVTHVGYYQEKLKGGV